LLAGTHNATNIAGVVAFCSLLSIDIDAVRTAVRNYSGTERRSEYIGKTKEGALVYDDYAHHPTEVKATLAAFRNLFPMRRLTVVFHPHTYSRTEALLSDFAQSFGDAARVIIIDVYGSAREKTGAVGSAELVSAINHFESGKAESAHDFEEAENLLHGTLEREDIVITMGAGDVWKLGRKLIS
jgi:UDP-N-acetylmuramate--alanine ligase